MIITDNITVSISLTEEGEEWLDTHIVEDEPR
jgi:hypothetical protein